MSSAPVEVAVVGGGPAGLAVAAMAARRGLSVTLLERSPLPHDKACGEGVMPPGLRVLDRLGVLARIPPGESGAIRGVRYVQEDGSTLEGGLPGAGGLGIRRTALSSVLLETARSAGAEVRDRTTLRSHRRTAEAMVLETDAGELLARVLVAADGLHSPLRRAEGLEVPARGQRRFGLRQHFLTEPWTDRVEVHLSPDAEAYVTPCGPSRVGVAFLWSDEGLRERASIAALLARFPFLGRRLTCAEPDSEPRGAGPFLQRARRRVAERLVLLGDAGGYVDAITGEGMSVALVCAEALAACLPEAVRREGDVRAFRPYVATARREFRKYAWTARAVLALARRPVLRRGVVDLLGRRPAAFEWLLARTVA
ncbi:MAG TPA: FAD-dependent oxidoreductase [Myxococcaceae bacterium]|nr:FAD-dependent oxidoreductase [Myxococcaceae bacterium]